MRLILALVALCAASARARERNVPTVSNEPTASTVSLPTALLPKLLIQEVTYGPDRADVEGEGQSVSLGLNEALTPAMVRDALSAELEKDGWPTTENPTFARARLKATVTRAHLKWIQTLWKGQRLSEANVRVVVTLEEADGREVWEGPLDAALTPNTWTGKDANFVKAGFELALDAAVSHLGTSLTKDRPWESLGKSQPVDASNGDAPQWWKK